MPENVKKNILVTGGAGFIGSHVCKKLLQRNFNVIILDNLTRGNRFIAEEKLKVQFYEGAINNENLVQEILKKHQIDAVMHFAAYAYVGESVNQPLMYYQNNTADTLTLFKTMLASNVNKIIFSSTCATYGIPDSLPINESTHQNPINPYGQSKLMVEKMLNDLAKSNNLQSIIFRYFNAAGSDPDCEIGELHSPETHLIPLALLNVLFNTGELKIFGSDYETVDGTCVRDYLHVNDIADAHILGLSAFSANQSKAYNLGTGSGYSVKQVINSIEKVTQKKLSVTNSTRRPGDPPILVADSTKAQRELNWKPQLSDIDTMVEHTWKWLNKINLM
jgi:UDP-glucose 4-epimerase